MIGFGARGVGLGLTMAGDTALPYVNRKGVGESVPVRLAGAVIIASPPGLRTMIVLSSAIGVTGILVPALCF